MLKILGRSANSVFVLFLSYKLNLGWGGDLNCLLAIFAVLHFSVMVTVGNYHRIPKPNRYWFIAAVVGMLVCAVVVISKAVELQGN